MSRECVFDNIGTNFFQFRYSLGAGSLWKSAEIVKFEIP